MKPSLSKNGGLSLALIAAVVAQLLAAAPSQAAENPITAPSWKDQTLVDVTLGVGKKSSITGQDLLEFAHPTEFKAFAERIEQLTSMGLMRPMAITPEQAFDQTMKSYSTQGIATLALARVLDNEAVKRGVSLEVSDERVDYVMRAVLTRNALNSREIKDAPALKAVPACEAANKSGKRLDLQPNKSLYDCFRQTVAENPVAINIDWQYRDGGTGFMLADIRRMKFDMALPAVKLEFPKLPASVQEFRASIRAQLQPVYQRVLRSEALNMLVSERNRTMGMESMFAVTTRQLDAYYDAMKESSFRVDRFEAKVVDVRVTGEQAMRFRDRFFEVLDQKAAELDAEFAVDQGEGQDRERDERLMGKAAKLRASVPDQVLLAVMDEFRQARLEGQLDVVSSEATLRHGALDAFPQDESFASQRLKAAFDPMFGAQLFPTLGGEDKDGSIGITMLREQKTLAPTYISKDDPRVKSVLRQQIALKLRGKAYRKAVHELLREHPIRIVNDACGDSKWACIETDPAKLAEALFPEVLFEGQKLPAGVTSTLKRGELADRVMQVRVPEQSLQDIAQAKGLDPKEPSPVRK